MIYLGKRCLKFEVVTFVELKFWVGFVNMTS